MYYSISLIPQGNMLFQSAGHWSGNWQLQQDNAPAHKTKENMVCIAANVPHILLICPLLRNYGPGWTRHWGGKSESRTQ